jgi:hypothetical protein
MVGFLSEYSESVLKLFGLDLGLKSAVQKKFAQAGFEPGAVWSFDHVTYQSIGPLHQMGLYALCTIYVMTTGWLPYIEGVFLLHIGCDPK